MPLENQLDHLLPKKELNPKLWRGTTIRSNIIEPLKIIALDFADEVNIDESKIKDIIITGSSSNYNWSKYSDIDLHIVVEYDDFSKNKELVENYFYAKKRLWNDEHNILFFGYEVEVYIQDEDEPHYASGVYSLKNDKWLHKPEYLSGKNIDKKGVINKTKTLVHIIKEIEQIFKDKEYKKAHKLAERLKKKIRKMRHHGLETNGEFSTENLAFKILRRLEYLKKLNNIYNKSYDEMRSL